MKTLEKAPDMRLKHDENRMLDIPLETSGEVSRYLLARSLAKVGKMERDMDRRKKGIPDKSSYL